MNTNSKQFKDLQRLWYDKLEKTGFKEIEQEDGLLKRWSTRVFSDKANGSYYNEKIEYYKSREEYYRLAGHFLHDYKFANKKEHRIWELHAEGVSIQAIVEIMTKARFKTSIKRAHQTIQRLVKEMKKTCL